jgi:deoxyadenosine/deoxycytidine kinase
MMSNSITIVSIEGNIGSGKSTVINTLKEYYKNNNNVYFLEEPVSEWVEIKDSDGKNIIEKFYENQEHYSFSFQMMAYISRLAMLKRAIKHCKEKGIKLIICERSLQTDKNVFCKMLYDSGKIEDINFQIYNKWFSEFITEIPLIYFVYIKTEPKIAHERVLKRNRKGENISVEYLEMCSKYHDNWLVKNGTNNCVNSNIDNCIVINGNEVSSTTFEKTNEIINKFIK